MLRNALPRVVRGRASSCVRPGLRQRACLPEPAARRILPQDPPRTRSVGGGERDGMNLGSVLRRTPAPVLGTVGALRYRSPGLYGDNRVYGRFIVLGHQRTGSTLVTSSLRRNPGVWCFSEVFN